MPRLPVIDPVAKSFRAGIFVLALSGLATPAWAKAAGPKPTGNPASWVTRADYPAQAWKEKRSGRTDFAIEVSASGKPQSCRITKSSGSEDLDVEACRLMMVRSVFKPATDDQGHPVAGLFESGAVWVIPPF